MWNQVKEVFTFNWPVFVFSYVFQAAFVVVLDDEPQCYDPVSMGSLMTCSTGYEYHMVYQVISHKWLNKILCHDKWINKPQFCNRVISCDIVQLHAVRYFGQFISSSSMAVDPAGIVKTAVHLIVSK